ncbi:MAG: HAMP domain-containing histidine kinase [Melioribacteraceae bacterium]|nr:HAMP domain-containing histidine kinase [Melioribacteraceae bacterium]
MTKEFLESFDKIDLQVRTSSYISTISIILMASLIIPLFNISIMFFNYNILIVVIIEFFILLAIFTINRAGETSIAANILVYSILLFTFALFYFSQFGIRDVYILILPVLLIFTGIVIDKKKYIIFSIILIFLFTGYTIFEILGIIGNTPPNKISFTSIINSVIILIITAVGVYFLTNDLRNSIDKLKKTALEFFEYQKKTQLKLIESEKKLQDLNSTKDIFLSVVAHDLKSPFQGLLGISNLLSTEFESFTKKEIKESIDNLSESLKKQYLLLEDLLQWGRLQRGTIPFEPKKDDIFEVISESIQVFAQSAVSKNITILNHSTPETFFVFDRYLISIVLRNLLSNAIKFSFPDSVVLIAAELKENKLTIKVKDTGKGIESKYRDRLFKLDSTFSTTGTKNETGTGLGLLLCHDIIIKHKGKISFISAPGKGSEFVCSIYN